MSEQTTPPEAPKTEKPEAAEKAPEAPKTEKPKAPETTAEQVAKIVADLRQAGATGKKQWEEALVKTRDLAAKAPARTRAELEAALARVRTTLSSSMERAQGRGANLLLRLVREVKARAQKAEAQLEGQAAAPAQ